MHPISEAQLATLLETNRIEKANVVINLFEPNAGKGGAFRSEDQATFYFSAKVTAETLTKILEAIKTNDQP